MANYQAISAVSQALVGYLQNAIRVSDFPTATVKLCLPTEYKTKPIDGITILLYRTAVNTAQRNMTARVRPDGQRYRLALPVDLFYLITPWASNPEQQHLLLGWALRTLEDTPEFPPALLDHYRTGLAPIFKPTETIQITYDSLSIQDLNAVMEIFKAQGQPPQLSIPYIVRMVALESLEERTLAPEVQTRGFDMAVPTGTGRP